MELNCSSIDQLADAISSDTIIRGKKARQARQTNKEFREISILNEWIYVAERILEYNSFI